MRLLHARDDPERLRFASEDASAHGRADPGTHGRQLVSLRQSHPCRRSHSGSGEGACVMSAQEKLTKEAHATQTDTAPMSRREFLGLTGSGLFVFFWAEPDGFFQEAAHPSQRSGYPEDFNAYLRIASDGRVTCLVGKIEMGEGVMTSLPMMLADELDVALNSVDIVMGDTDLCPWDMGTFGSLSTRQFGPILRKAGAEARGVLLQMA